MEALWLWGDFEEGFYTSKLDEWIPFFISLSLDKLPVECIPSVLTMTANVLLAACTVVYSYLLSNKPSSSRTVTALADSSTNSS